MKEEIIAYVIRNIRGKYKTKSSWDDLAGAKLYSNESNASKGIGQCYGPKADYMIVPVKITTLK